MADGVHHGPNMLMSRIIHKGTYHVMYDSPSDMNEVKLLRVLKFLLAIVITGGTIWFGIFQARLVGVHTVAFAVFINLILMGTSACVLGLLDPQLRSEYFTSKSFEDGGRLYRRLGVHHFPRLLRIVGSENIRRIMTPIRRDPDSLTQFLHRTRISETSHGMVALIVAALSIYVAVRYSIGEAKWLVITNVVFNIYPVMLQRYNRPRIERILRYQSNKNSQRSSSFDT